MAKDYAKRKNARKKSGASRSKNKKPTPKGLIFVTFLLVSALVALLVYLQWFKDYGVSRSNQLNLIDTKTNKKITPKLTNNDSDKKTSNKVNTEKTSQNDEVPFYQIHEEMINKTVDIPEDDLRLPEDEHKYNYLMPCGSFRDLKRAQELEAQIAFAGYESKVNQVTVKSGLWHRVELGPFKSKRKAESVRHRLQDNGFINCKIWPKKVK